MPEANTELNIVGGSDADAPFEPAAARTNTSSNIGSIVTTVTEDQVPDGGYGWTVIAACAVITWWFVGTTYSWGIIQAALVDEGLAKASTLSFVGSLTVACIAILAIANAKLVSFIGARKAGMLGISLLGLGEVLGSLSTNSVGGLFAAIGALMGIGT
ncbi:hypothetical protein LTR86_011267, partial [Recurvomyces mirabilis]